MHTTDHRGAHDFNRYPMYFFSTGMNQHVISLHCRLSFNTTGDAGRQQLETEGGSHLETTPPKVSFLSQTSPITAAGFSARRIQPQPTPDAHFCTRRHGSRHVIQREACDVRRSPPSLRGVGRIRSCASASTFAYNLAICGAWRQGNENHCVEHVYGCSKIFRLMVAETCLAHSHTFVDTALVVGWIVTTMVVLIVSGFLECNPVSSRFRLWAILKG